ncbi:unnamed protein product [Pseudo-nitzschia multistriata]|uniref:Uncharacterized protein n=1 Tax=Pseudo-nitzschia multistriata TaxID=183589 RepID=A0A448YZ16_9STRA|nr:unnamed protein product [Pseudo-nitzschia multistriata]
MDVSSVSSAIDATSTMPEPATYPRPPPTPAQVAAEASSRQSYLAPPASSSKKSWLDSFLDLVAYSVARILNHPDVRDAVSSAILEGMVKLCYVEDLHEHLRHVDETLTEHQVSDAAKKGKDAQKIVRAYLGGMFAGDNDESKTDDADNDSRRNSKHTENNNKKVR